MVNINLSRISREVCRYGCRQQASGLAHSPVGTKIAVSCPVLSPERIV